MNLSAMMSRQTAELQHTLNLGLLQSQMASQMAGATAMMENMTETAHMKEAPHPFKGGSVDLKG
ncbi:polyribonucleotide nucleotidyltransferase [Rossellomorea vietnamensis]|uniref:Polyribonucleotide nucleotidyltransferase n=1 Tax=Rossellomorea vietnamensis TaxID=218284 RepID=A0A5D4K759_9BACI|nr:polyribonucleotide nucleotidyltransferase [Rossellomorea vietnamensis]TYR72856.1 polyribonucleotide nucleotidyltransferase [Rossellomorea vietnamensis]